MKQKMLLAIIEEFSNAMMNNNMPFLIHWVFGTDFSVSQAMPRRYRSTSLQKEHLKVISPHARMQASVCTQ